MAPEDIRGPVSPWSVVGGCLPALLLAVAGLFHPGGFSAETAEHWRDLHIILLPVFPLLGLAPWFAMAGQHQTVRRLAAVLGYVYAVFYTALDALAGVGTGAVVLADPAADTGPLFAIGNVLSYVGVTAYLLASLLASGVLIRQHRLIAVPGAVLVLAASVSFLTSHIYWPRGVVTMLCFALGWGWLILVRRRPRQR